MNANFETCVAFVNGGDSVAERLTEQDIERRLAALPGWSLEDGKWLVKKARFRSYLDGVDFVSRAARAAERLNHHPLIAIDYKLVTLRLTSWRAGGITELDFEAAAAFDRELPGEGGAESAE